MYCTIIKRDSHDPDCFHFGVALLQDGIYKNFCVWFSCSVDAILELFELRDCHKDIFKTMRPNECRIANLTFSISDHQNTLQSWDEWPDKKLKRVYIND